MTGKLMEFMVIHDLVPVRTRWKRSSNGVGRMFNDVFHILDKNERAKLAEMMYSWGLEDANEIVETLKIGNYSDTFFSIKPVNTIKS